MKALARLFFPQIKPHFKHLIAELRYLPGVKLDIASRLYVSYQTKLFSSFNSDAKEIFDSSVERVDFESPIITADRINEWVICNGISNPYANRGVL